jgi:membrane associated rhomboid family serine protease
MNESARSDARYQIIERGIRSEELCDESIAARVESGEVTMAALVVRADQNHQRANTLVDAQPLVDWVELPSVPDEIRQRIKACQTGSAWNAPIPIRWFKRRWSPTRAIWSPAEVAWITTAADDAHVLLLQDGHSARRFTCRSLRFQGFTADGSAVVRRRWIPMAWHRKFAIAEQDFARLSYLQPLRSLSRRINSAADPERRARYAVPAPTPVTWLIIGACLLTFALQAALRSATGQALTGNEDWLGMTFGSQAEALYGGQIYRLVTWGFPHSDLGHVVGNSIGLLLIAPGLERAIGSRRLLFLYFTSLAASALVSASWNAHPGFNHGASGALMAVTGGLIAAVMRGIIPRFGCWIPFIFALEGVYWQIMWLVFPITFATWAPDEAAHVTGLIFGFFLVLVGATPVRFGTIAASRISRRFALTSAALVALAFLTGLTLRLGHPPKHERALELARATYQLREQALLSEIQSALLEPAPIELIRKASLESNDAISFDAGILALKLGIKTSDHGSRTPDEEFSIDGAEDAGTPSSIDAGLFAFAGTPTCSRLRDIATAHRAIAEDSPLVSIVWTLVAAQSAFRLNDIQGAHLELDQAIQAMDKLENGYSKQYLIDWVVAILSSVEQPTGILAYASRVSELAARDPTWGEEPHRIGAALRLALLFKRASREAEVTQLWNRFRSDSFKNQTDWQIGALAILGNDLENGRMLLRRAQCLKSVSENDRVWLAWALELPDQELQAEISGLFVPSEPTPLGEETETSE